MMGYLKQKFVWFCTLFFSKGYLFFVVKNNAVQYR